MPTNDTPLRLPWRFKKVIGNDSEGAVLDCDDEFLFEGPIAQARFIAAAPLMLEALEASDCECWDDPQPEEGDDATCLRCSALGLLHFMGGTP